MQHLFPVEILKSVYFPQTIEEKEKKECDSEK